MVRSRLPLSFAAVIASLISLYACVGEDPTIGGPGGGNLDGGSSGTSSSITLDPTSVTLAPGGSVSIGVKVVRGPGEEGSVDVGLDDPALAPAKAVVPTSDDRVELTLKALASAPVGPRTVRIRGVFQGTTLDADLALTIARPAGAIDPSFADGGVAVFTSPVADGGSWSLNGIAVAGGGIVAVGEATNLVDTARMDPRVVKLDSAGVLEETFGADGVAGDTGFSTSLRAVAVDSSGAIFSSGSGWPDGREVAVSLRVTSSGGTIGGEPTKTLPSASDPASGFALAALTAPGAQFVGGTDGSALRVWKLTGENTVVPTFDGTATWNGMPFPGPAKKLRGDTFGRVIVAAELETVGVIEDISSLAAIRFDATGKADSSFGNDGAAHVGSFVYEVQGRRPHAVSIDRHGEGYLIAGDMTRKANLNQRTVGLLKFDVDGKAADTSFGVGGLREVEISGGDDRLEDMLVDGSGRIYLAGASRFGTRSEGFVVRLLNDGSRDSSFGDGGVAKLPAGVNGKVSAIALLPDGNIVIAGTLTDPATSRLAGYVSRVFP